MKYRNIYIHIYIYTYIILYYMGYLILLLLLFAVSGPCRAGGYTHNRTSIGQAPLGRKASCSGLASSALHCGWRLYPPRFTFSQQTLALVRSMFPSLAQSLAKILSPYLSHRKRYPDRQTTFYKVVLDSCTQEAAANQEGL